MKIVHALGWYFPTTTGGTEVYVDSVAQQHARAGLRVRVVAPLTGATASESYSHGSVQVYRYPVPASATRAEARGDAMVRGAGDFHRWLAVERPDVVHFHTLLTGLDLLEVRAARRVGARVFLTAHTPSHGYLCARGTLLRFGRGACDGVQAARVCAACALQQRGVPRVAAMMLAAIPRSASRGCNRIEHRVGTVLGMRAFVEERRQRQHELLQELERFFVLTESGRRALEANGAPRHKIVINRLGINDQEIASSGSPRASKTPITVGFLGRFDPIKGLDDLLRAMTAVPWDLPIRLDVRGIASPDFPEVVARLERAVAADPRIVHGGAVARADVARVLESWDVLCCPGKWHEGGPTVALEALAVGTPVITSSFGGAAEILSDGINSRFFAPGDWRGLAAVLRDVATTPQILAAWREKLPAPRTMTDVAEQYVRAYFAA